MAAKTPTGANPLAWKETTPGTFTRPLDTIEAFFKWIGDLGVPLKRDHLSVSFAVRLALPCPTRFRHPKPSPTSGGHGSSSASSIPCCTHAPREIP